MNAIVAQEAGALAAPAQHSTAVAMSGPMGAAIQALQAGMTIEQMAGMLALQKDWEANEARKAYVADMAAFKLNPPEIVKDKLVGYANKDGSITGYMHATLGGVTKAVLEALAQHGFSHSWETKQANGLISVTCKITHRLGHSESTSMEASPDQSGKKNAIQSIASAVTYLSRYTLLAACGLATMDMTDDDGQGGVDPMDAPYTDSLIAQLKTTTTDADALAYWKAQKGSITSPQEYDRFKVACVAHRESINTGTKG